MSGDDETNAKGAKKSGGQKFRDCCRFFYNSEAGEVLGRGGKSWALILLFYLVYYGVLAGFFAICLIGFFKTMDDTAPTQQNMYSLLKQNPGMGFRPKPVIESTLIKFNASVPSTYEDYILNLKENLKKYGPDVAQVEGAIDCKDAPPDYRLDDQVCLFPLSNLGDNCTEANDYGYADGRPCVLLKMNRVFGWSPLPFENGTEAATGAEKFLKDRMDPNYVGVSCTGEIDADTDSINEVTYYPRNGFPSVFFPYRNQNGYIPPLVMAQFDVEPGRLIMIWCRAWAKNIKHHRVDLQGSVHFELLVDK